MSTRVLWGCLALIVIVFVLANSWLMRPYHTNYNPWYGWGIAFGLNPIVLFIVGWVSGRERLPSTVLMVAFFWVIWVMGPAVSAAGIGGFWFYLMKSLGWVNLTYLLGVGLLWVIGYFLGWLRRDG